jgi:type II secretory pathway pseudopilin PulG
VSLVEVLVVLAVVAVGSAAAMLPLNATARGATAQAEAQRLAARLNLAADEAILRAVPLRVEGDANGYRFATGAGALPAALERPHALPGGLGIASEGGEAAWALILSPAAAGRAQSLTLSGRGARARVEFDGLAARVVMEEAG